ncbi:MAG: HEAT repeat domain-containing protein [Promethearchaeota archaeon]
MSTFSEKYIQDLLDDLEDQDKYTRATALETLSDTVIDNQQLLEMLVPHFKRKLKDESSLVQMTAIESLGKVGKRFPDLIIDSIPFLCGFLKGQDQYLREGVLELLGEISTNPRIIQHTIPDIMELTKDSTPTIREKAIESIAKMFLTAPQLVPLQKFATALLAGNSKLRQQILPMLASGFVSSLLDANENTRTLALTSVKSLADKDLELINEIIPLLIEKLTNQNQNVVSLAIQSLIELLPLIKKALSIKKD